MKKPRSAKKPQPSAWAVALDAARNYAAECLGEDDGQNRKVDYMDDVVQAVLARRPDDPSLLVDDRIAQARDTGTEAGYMFALAVASVMRGPWDKLSLWEDESGSGRGGAR